MLHKHVLFFFLFLFTNSLFAQEVRLVKDITPGLASTFEISFFPEDREILLSFRDRILFMIKDTSDYPQLWVSNGEESGTYALHAPGANSFFGDFINEDAEEIYYELNTNNGNYIYSLSKTTLDTNRIHTNSEQVRLLTYLNDQLYFKADRELVKLDPATQASEVVYSFSNFRSIRDIGKLGDNLIIIGGRSSTALFISDGTTAGTQEYYELNDGSEFSEQYYMTEVDGKLFFFYNKPSEPYILYVTDGTANGTMPLIELEKIAFGQLEKDRSIIGWDGKLFFRGRGLGNSSNQEELYVSDGTVNGTFLIDINDEWAKPEYFTVYKNELYFKADVAGFIFRVYKTDGTVAGTVEAIDANTLGTGLSFGGDYMVEHEDSLYFYAYRSQVGEELWASAGTTNTTRVIDITPGEDDTAPSQMISTDNYLFLIYNSAEYGKELFVLDRNIVSNTELTSSPVSVYPNPFQDRIYIESDEPITTSWITDLTGRRYTMLNDRINEINLADLPSGVYFLYLETQSGLYMEKLIKP